MNSSTGLKILTGYEKLYFNYPANVVLVGVVKPSLPSPAIEKALSLIQKKYSVFNQSISRIGKSLQFLPKIDAQIPLIEKKTTNVESWTEIVQEEIKYKLGYDNTPLIRIIHVFDSQRSAIIINCHHIICDGLSLTYLLRDILKYLYYPSSKEITDSKFSRLLETHIPTPRTLNLKQRVSFKIINSLWHFKGKSFSQNLFNDFFSNFWRENNVEIVKWKLSKPSSQTLIQKCKKNGVTVQNFLYTLILTADNIQSRKKTRTIFTPVNVRPRLTEDPTDNFGLFAVRVLLRLNLKENKDFWTQTIDYQKQLIYQLTDENIFDFFYKFDFINSDFLKGLFLNRYGVVQDKFLSFFARKLQTNEIAYDYIISNLGRLDIPSKYGNVIIEEIYGPIVYADTARIVLGVLSIDEVLHFVITYNPKLIEQNEIIRLRDSSLQIIQKIIEDYPQRH